MTDIVDQLREALREARRGLEYWGPITGQGFDEKERITAMVDAALEAAEAGAQGTGSAADEIQRLRDKCDQQAMILRRLTPENFPDTYFICGEAGKRDQNGMPKKILVAPAYGVDFAYEYEYNGQVGGPEW